MSSSTNDNDGTTEAGQADPKPKNDDEQQVTSSTTTAKGGKASVYEYWNTSIEQDRAAAKKVEERIANQSPDEQHAARKLQSQYKAYTARREANGMNLTSSARWTDGIKQRKLAKAGQDQDKGKNDTTSRWKRTGLYATQISEGHHDKQQPHELSEGEEIDRLARNKKERKKIAKERDVSKAMEKNYWLEMVDSKHRYASNLKWYHQYWNENVDTNENFFHWLDHGGGKDLELDQCPRSRLDKERITYLTAEQRQNYLVDFDEKGHLVWHKNKEPINTSREFRDAGPNCGIVPMNEEEMKKRDNDEMERRKKRPGKNQSPLSSSSSESSDPSEDEKDRQGVKGYHEKGFTAGQGKGLSQFKERMSYYSSPKHVMDHLLRKTINKNTWLYVCDLSGKLYVGIKKTGEFQHSSFLYGARVMSAGLIKVDNGKLTSLSPLSGHYRSGSMHFKAFLRHLEEQKVDLSSVMISKSILTIRGIEKYGAANKKKKRFAAKFKETLHLGGNEDEQKAKEREQMDKSAHKTKKDDKKEKTAKEAMEGPSSSDDSSSSDDGEGQFDEHQEQERSQSALSQRLPGEGKSKEEMTEDERTERGIALVQRAFERGIDANNQRLKEDSQKKTEQDKQRKAQQDQQEHQSDDKHE